jgi:signal transduction histidine kinase
MAKKKDFKLHVKTVLAIIWFAFTFSLVTWWWVFLLSRLNIATGSHRMFAWEGSILLVAILTGGIALIFFTYKDQKRHEKMRLFFANFSHDIKTSITRLRLQGEVLEEDLQGNPVLKRLLQDIQRLDLQLENSLHLANIDGELFEEKISLSDLVASLRNEFSEITIELTNDATLIGDRRALLSVFRNIFQNSVLHGNASVVSLKLREGARSKIELTVTDNGLGDTGKNQKGNGIGLSITKRLLKKMKGDLVVPTIAANQGFVVVITLPGVLR